MIRYIEQLVTLGFLAAMMWGMLKFMLRDIHNDLGNIKKELSEMRNDIKKGEARTDHLYEENNRLYHVLLDIVQKK